MPHASERHYKSGMAVLNGGHLYCSEQCGGHGMPFAFAPDTFYCGQPLKDRADYTKEAQKAVAASSNGEASARRLASLVGKNIKKSAKGKSHGKG